MQESRKSPEQVEQERLTRRQALRKLGFGAGLSAFMLLGVDDLARMVGQRIQQMDSDNKVANQIAKEFQSAGIALAAGPNAQPLSPSGVCNEFQNMGGETFCDQCEQERYDYCINIAGCSTLTCNQAANCASNVCASPTRSYAALKACWASSCAACLANCN